MDPLKTPASSLRQWLPLLLLLSFSDAHAQNLGDYGSWVSGNWTVPGTWRVFNGNWSTSPAATVAPGASTTVYILTGRTVLLNGSGPYQIGNINVESGGRLWTNNSGNANVYLTLNGTYINCDGQIGNGATYDAISFNANSANITITGTGIIDVARIRKEGGAAITNLVFDADVNLRFNWGGGTITALYNEFSPSTLNITVLPTRTLNIDASGMVGGSVCIDGTGGLGGTCMGSITVLGRLLVEGTLFATTNNGAGNPCSITVGVGGYVRTAQLHGAASGLGGHSFFVSAGGTLEITGTPTAWSAFSQTNNTYNFANSSTVIYSGLGNQFVEMPTNGVPGLPGYGGLRISGSGVKTLRTNTRVRGSLVIDNLLGPAVLDVSSSLFNLTVEGNWSNYSASGFDERTSTATVLFAGGAAQTISTMGGERFNNWTLNKVLPNPNVLMNSNVEVANNLLFNTANNVLDLGGYELGLLNSAATAISVPSGSFGVNRSMRSELQSNASRVRWDIGTTTGAHVVPFSTSADYIPFTFNLVSGNAGSVTMATYGTPQNNLAWPVTPTAVTNLTSSVTGLDNADATVDRFWQVDVTGTPTASLTFTYAPSELPIAPWDDPLALRAQRWNSATQAWELQVEGSSAANYATTDVTVTSFGPFTLTPIISPLPIELLSFHAQPMGKEVTLEWVTASERNNDYFTVLRSADGFRFEPILHVEGAGNSATAIRYADVDEQPLQGLSYYKLRQTDMDGTTSESQVVAVRFSASKGGSLVAWPNPAESELNLAGFGGTNAEVRLMDAAGRVVLLERTTSDTQRLVLPLYGLARGSYTVQVLGDGGLNSLPVVLH